MSLALYRKYRPSTFTEVIGQDHVTVPLRQALRNDRVHHAYLFSGPRGCGKTTSARILARCLNCEQGPTPDPCGVCQSCVDLAAGGAGSIDVIEIDAASHGGVDDARDLRERAFFAPAASRYKIYIVDEAHMVSTQGFNALLKVVEEPPEHLKFIFATTEPDKVIGTIRSRTHHYPFRLVPPSVLREHLTRLSEFEQVRVEPGVLPLVVRAGAGSVRDAMSVLDQLVAGAGADGVTYAMATGLLGYTDATLLDDVIDAFAAHDGAAVFETVDRIVEGGHDPRRFVADLLERLRDLVILDAVPDAASKRLIDAPEDQVERMVAQAARYGRAALTRAADIVNEGLTEMRGATAPRLQLELICARVLLPGADDREQGLATRLEQLERRLALGGVSTAAAREPQAAAASRMGVDDADRRPAQAAAEAVQPAPDAADVAPAAAAAEPTAVAAEPTALAAESTAVAAAVPPADEPVVDESAFEPAAPVPAADVNAAAPASPSADVISIRRSWPEVLDAVKKRRRYTWMLLLDDVQVLGIGDGVLTLAFGDEGKRRNFTATGSDDVLSQAIIDVLQVDWRIDAVLDPNRARSGRGGSAQQSAATVGTPTAPGTSDAAAAEKANGRSRAEERLRLGDGAVRAVDPADDVPSEDDPDVDENGASGTELVERMLGARKIGEFETP